MAKPGPGALARLGRHHWPGHVRELENGIGRAVALAAGTLGGKEQLPETLSTRTDSPEQPTLGAGFMLDEYLAGLERTLKSEGFPVRTLLAMGDPVTELVRTAEAEASDLIAMSTHGHRFLADVVKGTTVDRLRHLVKIPVLLLRAQP